MTSPWLSQQPALDAAATAGTRFAGQGVIVSGGAGGIGSAIVLRFLNDGAKVAIVDVDAEAGARVLEELGALGLAAGVSFHECDIARRDECFKVVQEACGKLGRLHHLVNCAAVFISEGLTATEQDWQRTMAVNVMGPSFMAAACVSSMELHSRTESCSITNVSSISAHQVQPNRWTYGASKGAINILTKDMALDLAERRIRVNSVSPGWTWSPEVAKAAVDGGRERWEPIWGRFSICGRLAELAEVAAAIVFLASKDASFINATDLKVDGGYGAMSAEGSGDSSAFAPSSTFQQGS